MENEKPTRTFTMEQVARLNGSFGAPAYVVVNGLVYDVTDLPVWAEGKHFGQIAGTDLTAALSCHNGQTVLNKLKLVGTLVK